MPDRLPWLSVKEDPPDPIPMEIAQLIAAILIEWSRFENAIVVDTHSLRRQFPNIRSLSTKAPPNFRQKIELWRDSVKRAYPSVTQYHAVAAEVCTKGKIVANMRHRLIHGEWRPSKPGEPGNYQVYNLKVLDVVEEHVAFHVDAEILDAVRNDIRSVVGALYTFLANRMLHSAIRHP